MSHYVATGVYAGKYVELVSIKDGKVLLRCTDGQLRDVRYTELENVWPTAQVLDNYDELAAELGEEIVTGMFETLTGTGEWAEVVTSTWRNLY